MAFCPNCGTPNTDQAEKCVSCGFELAPKQKAKFKGTMMMTGVPVATPAKPGAPTPQAAPAPPAQPAAPAVFTPASHQPQSAPPGGKNLGFEKTMMGPMGTPPGARATPPASVPAQVPLASDPSDLGRAPTIEQPAPNFHQPPASYQPPAQPAQPSFQAPSAPSSSAPTPAAPTTSAAATSHGPQTFGSGVGPFDNTDEVEPKSKGSAGKMIAIGCVAVLLLGCVISGVVLWMKGKQLFSIAEKIQSEGPTLEWRTRVAQALENVAELCKTDCQGAAIYFHPELKDALVGEAKSLSANALLKLSDPTQSEARMLDSTDDADVATKLNLDPQQCVRVMSGAARVIGCSVPDQGGSKSLRIVAMSGLSSL